MYLLEIRVVSEYRTEEEQAEALKKWWNENGKFIIAGIVIGISAIFGWRGYNNHVAQQAEAASLLYEQMIIASREDDNENIGIYANRIIEDYKSSAYATFATLMLAKLAAEANNLDEAETHLRWVMNNSSEDGFKHVARLRLSRVLIASDKLDEAMKTLNISNTGDFSARYDELRGDIYVKQNKIEDARQAYQKALANSATPEGGQSILQMKLDDLGRI
jgi:predicted negative regulator of RcsB-dependent stress response